MEGFSLANATRLIGLSEERLRVVSLRNNTWLICDITDQCWYHLDTAIAIHVVLVVGFLLFSLKAEDRKDRGA
jgi:hypothetical protein